MPNRMSEEISDPRELLPLYKRYNNLGVVAFFCSCAGLMVASFESVGWMAIPLAAAGLVLGVLAVLSLEPRKGGAGFPVASVCVSVPALLLLIFFPGALGVQRGREYELSPDLVTQMAVSRGDALAETHERVREADWLDASTQSVELGDVRVRVLSAAVKKIQVNSAHGPRESTDKFLVVTLQFMNKSVARTVSFTSWDMVGPSAPALGGPTSILSAFDNKGKTYAMLLSAPGQEPVGHVRNTTLFPGKPVQDVLVFAAPSADVEFIRLQLAATAFGAKGNLHLQIPKRMIAFK